MRYHDNASVRATAPSERSMLPAPLAAEYGEDMQATAPFFFPVPLVVAFPAPLCPDFKLGGNKLTAAVGCVSIFPLPIVTKVPLLGMPFIVTNSSAGPGWKRLG